MSPLSRSGLKWSALAGLLLLLLSVPTFESKAQMNLIQESTELEKIELTVGKSVLLRTPDPIRRASIADLEIADFNLLSPREMYITGKASGVTNITLWQSGDRLQVYDVVVTPDVSTFKQKLHELLPDERDIRVLAFDDSITLTGRISSTACLAQALALAQVYVPEGKVRNLLEVAGVHQVMLEVKISEMSRTLLQKLGVNWMYTNSDGEFGIGMLGQLAGLATGGDSNLGGGALGLLVSPAANAIFRFNSGNGTHTVMIDALEEEGLLKVLAEPTLIALSGQTATFLAGGEFPVPVPQGLGTVGVEYKTFGVALAFTPTVLDRNKISMHVVPEVSELDYTNALQIGGYVVPGLSTRRASTVIELGDGQTFAIAGLLKDTTLDRMSKYPFLGDIPVLGNLFRSRGFQNNETELVILVTPHLVKPLDPDNQALPTDYYVEPTAIDFYVWGALEGALQRPELEQVDLEGDFGHTIPMLD
jgi:pilus assembly protein CpaC